MSDRKAKAAAKPATAGKPAKSPKSAKSAKSAAKRGRRAGEGGNAAEAGSGAPFTIAGHPRARQSVRQVKSWVGLAGFLLALVLSLQASVPLTIAAERALVAGVAGYLVAWGCAVAVWRALLAAEVRARVEALTARRDPAAVPAAKTTAR